MSVVVDASAVLAILFGERGHEAAAAAARGSFLSAVNMTEVLEKFARRTGASGSVGAELLALEIAVVPFDDAQARIAAGLKGRVGKKDSLADRACLALAMHTGSSCVTGDHKWAELDLGIEIVLFREYVPRT